MQWIGGPQSWPAQSSPCCVLSGDIHFPRQTVWAGYTWTSCLHSLVEHSGFVFNRISQRSWPQFLVFKKKRKFIFKKIFLPWLVCLCGLSTGLRTKGSLVQFPVRAHAWVAGPSMGGGRGNPHWCFSLSLFPSLPLSLKINKFFKKISSWSK